MKKIRGRMFLHPCFNTFGHYRPHGLMRPEAETMRSHLSSHKRMLRSKLSFYWEIAVFRGEGNLSSYSIESHWSYMTRTKCEVAGREAAEELGIELADVVVPEPWSKKLIARDKREEETLKELKKELDRRARMRLRGKEPKGPPIKSLKDFKERLKKKKAANKKRIEARVKKRSKSK